jgi:hypothetical protein
MTFTHGTIVAFGDTIGRRSADIIYVHLYNFDHAQSEVIRPCPNLHIDLWIG